MKVILIGNYPLDRLESMERFAQMLQSGLITEGVEAEIWRPRVFFASSLKSTSHGFRKWIGYVDKWLLFPLILRWRQLSSHLKGTNVRFHVCDHSNAPYLAHLPVGQTSITCHDVIAIRGAAGHSDAHTKATWGSGMIYQKWISHHLIRAQVLAAVSQATYEQLYSLIPPQLTGPREWRVIHNAFNANFSPVTGSASDTLLKQAGVDPAQPFILHIGSKHQRKNRKMLLDMVAALGNRWGGNICYAGQPIDEALQSHAESLGLQNRVMSVVKPDHTLLQVLYSACEAFVFPSLSEGFGWPLIEAQACGTPVIASNIAPLLEVSGGTALHADPNEPQAFAEALLTLKDEAVRADWIQKGFENCNRFKPSQMIRSYLRLFDNQLN